MGNLGYCIDIIELDVRIADRFKENCSGIIIDEFTVSLRISSVLNELGFHTVLRQKFRQIKLCGTVKR